MHARVVLGVMGKGVLFREVSSVQECPHREREHFMPNQKEGGLIKPHTIAFTTTSYIRSEYVYTYILHLFNYTL